MTNPKIVASLVTLAVVSAATSACSSTENTYPYPYAASSPYGKALPSRISGTSSSR